MVSLVIDSTRLRGEPNYWVVTASNKYGAYICDKGDHGIISSTEDSIHW